MRNALVCLLLFAAGLSAQNFGTIVGTVRDATGAALPGASVAAVNNATGIRYEAKTNTAGDYRLATLPPGVYTFNFNAPSFAEMVFDKIEVHVSTTVRLDASLALATVSQTVEVVGATPLVNADTSEVGALVRQKQIAELPLNGRNVYSLLSLLPGTESEGSITRPSVAGGRAGYTRFRVDGIDVNSNNTVSAMVQPSSDAVEEFQADTQLASAARASSSGVNVAIRSGTNAFHGTAFDFLRNNVLDAHQFFERPIQAPGFTYTRNQLRYNQFGGTLGGPIIKEKTFFFFSYEGLRQTTAQEVTGMYPTAAMLAGDFSGVNPTTGKKMQNFGPIFDPTTLLPFPGNKIPAARISSFASGFSKFIPAANCMNCLADGLGFNLVGTSPGFANYDEYIGRIDHLFSDADHLSGSFTVRPGNGSASPSAVKVTRTRNDSNTYLGTITETHTFGPNLLNELRAGYVRNSATGAGQEDANGAFGFQNTPFRSPDIFPSLGVAGYNTFGSNTGQRFFTVEEAYNLLDDVTWTHSTHTLRAGFEIRRNHLWNVSGANAILQFVDNLPPQFGYSLNGFSDYLLGLPSAGLTFQGTGKANMVERTVFGSYVQDDWKVSSRLTLNLGLRWEFAQRWHDKDTSLNRLGTLDLSPESQAIGGRFLLGGQSQYYVPGKGLLGTANGAPLIRGSLIDPAWRNFMPRLGFAFRPFNDNRTAIRGGYGIYYTLPDAASVIFETATPPYYYFSALVNLPPQVPLGKPLTINQFFPLGGPQGTGAVGSNPRNLDPRMDQWTIGIQHQAFSNMLFEVEYMGNRGNNLPFTLFVNEPSLPNAVEMTQLLANPALNQTLAQMRAPFQAIGLGFQYDNHVAKSWYNALNLRVQGRLGPLTLSSFYTFAKALDYASGEQNAVPTTTKNLALNKSYADFDHTHRFITNWIYELPFGKSIGASASPLAKKLIGGWEVSGIASFESGPPYNITMGQDTSFRGGSLPVYPILNGAPVTTDIRQTGGIYLTEANFSAPPFGQLGMLARNAYHGPGINNFDLGLHKNTTFKETRVLQFRADMFNGFNHAQFLYGGGGLLRGIAAPAAGTTTPVLQWVDPSQFGRASARSARVIQMGLKLIF